MEKNFNELIPKFLTHIEQFLSEKGTNFLFGSKCVTADFCVGSVYTNYANNPNTLGKERWDEIL